MRVAAHGDHHLQTLVLPSTKDKGRHSLHPVAHGRQHQFQELLQVAGGDQALFQFLQQVDILA